MRFHKAITISKPEADFIIETGTAAKSDVVVVSRGDKYYDVRTMTHAEVDAFVADLARAEHAALAADRELPC
jgi:translation initiation factor IF-2